MFSLFKSILAKVGIGTAETAAPAAVPAPAAEPAPVVAPTPAPEAAVEPAVQSSPQSPLVAGPAAEVAAAAPESAPVVAPTPAPAPAKPEPVDVVTLLDAKVKTSSEKDLDWRRSIVDLLKLLELDSSLKARQGLAKELGYTGSTAGSHSAEMNIWLIKEVLKRLAENGGNIPKELTH